MIMSNSRFQNSAKSENSTPTIGFRFHANDEELEEVQSEQDTTSDKKNEINLKLDTALNTSDSLEGAKSEGKNEPIGDTVRDQWNRLGRRSTSVDSTYESPFSNPIETWRKLNVLKEKLTKTVEEKISEMKIDRNRARLINSKENSSISDSEDTSESSKLSESWRDAEDLNSSSTKQQNENSNMSSSPLEAALLEIVKMKTENKEPESELRKRTASTKISDLLNIADIKIATAKTEIENNIPGLEDSLEDVESGVEAEENLGPIESGSIDFFDEATIQSDGDGSQRPPWGNQIQIMLRFCTSIVLSQKLSTVVLIGSLFYLVFPLPEFFRGFLLCLLLALMWELFKNYVQFDDTRPFAQQNAFVMPNYKSMPPLKVPNWKPAKGVWVNEYEKDLYDPDYYSVTQTVSAYLELDSSILKISRPKGKVNRRATYDEPEYKLHFISQRVYNISGCNVYLMPDGLTRKRLFSKKYPIVIFLRPDSLISEKIKGKTTDLQDNLEESHLTAVESVKQKSSLYIFARCDRQKEEWYRRLLAATRLTSTPVHKGNPKIPEFSEEPENLDESPTKEPSTPFEHLFFDDDTAEIEEYLRYMSKFLDEEVIHPDVKKLKNHSTWYKKLKTKKKDIHGQENEVEPPLGKSVALYKKGKPTRISVDNEPNDESEHDDPLPSLQVQWFNAFINRILYDVFRSPYWLNKIHDKIQRKLNSIRMPYYIEDIEVIEMDLGKTGPMFHRVSQPYIDERGLWFDMDATFDGLIKLTIQTHLNLLKLQKGMEEEEMAAHLNDKMVNEKESKKEARDAFLIKDSVEKSKEQSHRKQKKLEKKNTAEMEAEENCIRQSSQSSQPEKSLHELVDKDSEDSKLIDEVAQFAEIVVEEGLNKTNKRSAIYDSDLEDSAESSDEEEEEEVQPPVEPSPETEEPQPVSTARRYPRNRRSSKKIFRVFENVAQSKYFRSVAQSKYVKKAIAGVSATKLRLTLEVKSCTGILTINIPPPPSDRFWYGFREMPNLVFSANPKIGDKPVRFIHIKNFLQKKILHEVKKVMVAPNMIDFVLPTSSPARSPSSLQIEQSDITEQEATPPE